MSGYKLRCHACSAPVPDGFLPACDCGKPSLVTVDYTQTSFFPSDRRNMWKFADWLPVNGIPVSASAKPMESQSVVFSSPELSELTGLPNLHCVFTGYWPEHGAYETSCSFKGLEAHPTLQRARETGVKGLIIASAGNTARAFLQNAFHYGVEVVAVVPEASLEHLWVPGDSIPEDRMPGNRGSGNRMPGNRIPGNADAEMIIDTAKIIAVKGDYLDAITVAGRLDFMKGFQPEGGARNIARRDGMGTVLLEYAMKTGHIPDHYFQAIGSGTGAIAALEAARRLRLAGGFGDYLPGLHLSQNIPFTPMADAWAAGSRELTTGETCFDQTAPDLYASMLSNRRPPYSISGGVFDCLTATNGEMYAVGTMAAKDAGRIFTEAEGREGVTIDLAPEAEVALASLMTAVAEGTVRTDERVCLNLTGGGFRRLEEDTGLTRIEPDIIISDPCIEGEELKALFK